MTLPDYAAGTGPAHCTVAPRRANHRFGPGRWAGPLGPVQWAGTTTAQRSVKLMNANVLMMGVVVSSLGMGMFVYGKKAARWPHLVVGFALMVLPFLVTSVLGLSLITLALLAITWLLRER